MCMHSAHAIRHCLLLCKHRIIWGGHVRHKHRPGCCSSNSFSEEVCIKPQLTHTVCWRIRNTDEWHRLQWAQAEDEIGQQMLALFRDANALRRTYPALRRGGVSILHEVRHGCGSVALCCACGFVAIRTAVSCMVKDAQLVCELLWCLCAWAYGQTSWNAPLGRPVHGILRGINRIQTR